MNNVTLIGRLTRDPESRENAGMAICSFSIAIDRPPKKDGTREADFPRITAFGKQAENCLKYLTKGRLVAIEGRIQTGSYTNRNGDKVYTTDVVANRVEFLEWGNMQNQNQNQSAPQSAPNGQAPAPQLASAPATAPAPAPAPAAPQPEPAAQPMTPQAPVQPAPAPQPEPAPAPAPTSEFVEVDDDEW